MTAFAAGSVTDILDSMTNQESLLPGPVFTGYSYMFKNEGHLDAEWYRSGRDDIMNSEEVSGYKEMNVVYNMDCVPLNCYKEEYMVAVKEILGKWFPYGLPEKLQQALLGNDKTSGNPFTNPTANFIILNEKDFHKLSEKAGIDLSKYDGAETEPALVYDSLKLSTHDYMFFDEGAENGICRKD